MNRSSLPAHRLHPHTGLPLVPVGYTRRGPIWPVLGASEDDGAGTGTDDGGGDDGGEGDKGGADDKGGDGQGDDSGKPAEGAPKQKDGESDADWRARSRTWEQRSKANKKTADDAIAERDGMARILAEFRKALDPDGAGKDDDPKTLAEKAIAERDNAAAELRLLKTERAAEKAARTAGADPDRLLDSAAFLGRLKKLDPSDEAFADDLKAAVIDALKANPHLKATPTPKTPPSADMSNGGASGGSDGPKSIDDIRAARSKRRGTG